MAFWAATPFFCTPFLLVFLICPPLYLFLVTNERDFHVLGLHDFYQFFDCVINGLQFLALQFFQSLDHFILDWAGPSFNRTLISLSQQIRLLVLQVTS
jgi:hypothetical protein